MAALFQHPFADLDLLDVVGKDHAGTTGCRWHCMLLPSPAGSAGCWCDAAAPSRAR